MNALENIPSLVGRLAPHLAPHWTQEILAAQGMLWSKTIAFVRWVPQNGSSGDDRFRQESQFGSRKVKYRAVSGISTGLVTEDDIVKN
jgi:hypothetical protein